MLVPNEAENRFGKIQLTFMTQRFYKLATDENHFNIAKATNGKIHSIRLRALALSCHKTELF